MSFGLIPKFTTGMYKVERSTPGDFVRGRFRPGDIEIITMRGSLQPASGQELKQSTEGERLKDHFVFFSDEPLSTIKTGTSTQSDKVKIDCETYRVISVETWKNVLSFGGIDLPHFKTMLYREPQQ